MRTTTALIVSALALCHIVLGILSIRAMGQTYDEPVHLAAGYSYLKTADHRLNASDHPPFANIWSALPLLAMNPTLPTDHPYWKDAYSHQFPLAEIFMHQNRVDAESMLHAGRAMILLLSLALGGIMFLWARELGGDAAGIMAAGMWAFMPAFIANGTLVTTDMAMTLFFAASVYAGWRWMKGLKEAQGGWGRATVLGVALGLALTSKYSAAIIAPVLAVALAGSWHGGTFTPDRRAMRDFGITLLAAAATILIVYQGQEVDRYYFPGLVRVLTRVSKGRSTFLMGHHSSTG